MKKYEHKLQCSCVKWFKMQYKKYKLNLFAVPNGAKRDVISANYYTSEGLTAGVADLFLSVPNNEYHGLFIEMKSNNGRQTESQKDFQTVVEAQNYRYELINSFADFMLLIEEYLENK